MRLPFLLLPLLVLGISGCSDSEDEVKQSALLEESAVLEEPKAVAKVEGPTVRVLANGKTIGFYLEGGQYQVGVISKKGYPFWISLSNTFGAHGSIIRKQRPFYFEGSGCTGTPYVASGGTKHAMWDGEMIRSPNPDDPVQLYYVPRGAEPQKIMFSSVRSEQMLRETNASGISYQTVSKCTATPALFALSAVQVFENDFDITGVQDTIQYEMPVTIEW
ncbi:MAG: hypothetical protein ABUK11_05480 [Mariprofundaceae bacterium]